VQVRYQACSDQTCLLPQTSAVPLTFKPLPSGVRKRGRYHHGTPVEAAVSRRPIASQIGSQEAMPQKLTPYVRASLVGLSADNGTSNWTVMRNIVLHRPRNHTALKARSEAVGR
jgi:hypothetical protein